MVDYAIANQIRPFQLPDAAGIAGAIRTLRRDPELAARLARGALACAGRHFNWTRSAVALASFYDTLTRS